MRIRAVRDFLSGAIFVAIGSAFALVAGRYPIGSAMEMGPGYMPAVLGWILAFLGLILLVRSVVIEGPALSPIDLRSIGVVVLSIVLFGLTYAPFGLVAAIVVMVLTACLASPESKLIESVIAAVLLSAMTTFLFVYFLKLPLRVWPEL